jgi:hypothetical protein
MRDQLIKIRMTWEMRNWVVQEAARRQVSASEIVRELIQRAIARGPRREERV